MSIDKKSSKTAVQEKDISIELLRIYACVMVIWAHIQISYMVDHTINKASFIIKCMIGDNVPIFLLILGFYMFHGVQGENRIQKIPKVYIYKLKGFLIKIYIPTIFVTLIACFADDFIYRQKTFTQLFTQFHMNWEYLKNYVLYQSPKDMVGQFWYIVVYIKLVIFFPILAFLCVDDRQYTMLRRTYMLLSFFSIVLENIGFLRNTTMLKISDYVFDRHFLYVLLGYELALFFRKTKLPKNFQIILSITIFMSGVIFRYALTMYSFQLFGVASNSYFMGLECAPAYISSAGCLMTFYSIFRNRHNRVIQFLGSLTFYIYMVHGMMLRYFSDIGAKIRNITENGASNWQSIKYYFAYGAVIFFTSLIFGFILKLIYDGICRLIHYLYEKSNLHRPQQREHR